MRVLVMGGTQFNGLALVRELVRTGHDVTVLNRGQTAGGPAAVGAAAARRPHRPRADARALRPRGVRLRAGHQRVPPRRRRADDRALPRQDRPLHLRQLDGDLRGVGSAADRRGPPGRSRSGADRVRPAQAAVRGHPRARRTASAASPRRSCRSRWCSGRTTRCLDREQRMFVRLLRRSADPHPRRRHRRSARSATSTTRRARCA